jgi:hypothetical protein
MHPNKAGMNVLLPLASWLSLLSTIRHCFAHNVVHVRYSLFHWRIRRSIQVELYMQVELVVSRWSLHDKQRWCNKLNLPRLYAKHPQNIHHCIHHCIHRFTFPVCTYGDIMSSCFKLLSQFNSISTVEATLAEEAPVAVPEVQCVPSMFAWLFNQPHSSSTALHCEKPPKTPPTYCRQKTPNLLHHNLLH